MVDCVVPVSSRAVPSDADQLHAYGILVPAVVNYIFVQKVSVQLLTRELQQDQRLAIDKQSQP